jgi:hypothetical protein
MTGEPLEPLAYGLYEALLDERLKEIFRLHPDLHPVFGKVDPEEEPSRYVSFVSQVLNQALQESPPEKRIRLVNHLLEQIVLDGGLDDFRDKRLVPDEKSLLLEVTPPHYSGRTGLPRPQTPLAKSSLFTGSPSGTTGICVLLGKKRKNGLICLGSRPFLFCIMGRLTQIY